MSMIRIGDRTFDTDHMDSDEIAVIQQDRKHSWVCRGNHGAEQWECNTCGATDHATWGTPPETPCRGSYN